MAKVAILLLLAVSSGCGGSEDSSDNTSITLYTCVSDTTIGPVIEAFEDANPGTKVELFRAPTGDLNARVAGDVRSGGLKADVVWACDPLTMQDYVDQGLVGGWTPTTSSPPSSAPTTTSAWPSSTWSPLPARSQRASRDLVGPDRDGVRRRGCRA